MNFSLVDTCPKVLARICVARGLNLGLRLTASPRVTPGYLVVHMHQLVEIKNQRKL
jgi:hypothetical protein